MDHTRAMQAGAEGMRAYVEALAKDRKLATAHARYLRNLYDALLAEGFREDQALQIVAMSTLPGAR